MAMNHMISTNLGYYYVALLTVIACMFSDQCVTARNYLSVKHKGTVKTIHTDYGDVIDCVDIYKQPAFDHPLLKNHKIEMDFSSPIKGANPKKSTPVQSWQKSGQYCPDGTVPIRRVHQKNIRKSRSISWHNMTVNDSSDVHEYAVVVQYGGDYYGGSATINVWNPTVEIDNEFSLAQIWVQSDGKGELPRNTVETGMQVYPYLYQDNRTRFYVYWTGDNYQTTGCYNLDCPGFVQTSTKIYTGTPITPVSTYGGKQYDIAVTIYKNTESGNWWLEYGSEVVGYWPGKLFNNLDVAAQIHYGGEIINEKSDGRHTSTQMGSGHFPSENLGKASFFRDVSFLDKFGQLQTANNLAAVTSQSLCYDINDISEGAGSNGGASFYFGGPGYSKNCP